jgi:heat shock protein HslJ
MKATTFLILILAVSFGINSCKSSKKSTAKFEIPVGDNSMTSLDWDGTYQGILPCADCEGIKTQLVLKEDLSYNLITSYLGKEENIFETKGTFTWDKNGSNIMLDNSEKQVYKVGENKLFLLDKSGNRIEGNLAKNYTLEKEDMEITDKHWELVQLNGKTIEVDKDAFIKLDSENNHFNGNSSCNVINGSFELSGNNGITLSNIVMTRMACIDNNVEHEFLQVLNQITNYLITKNELLLQNSQGIVLAKFQSDFFN